MDTMKAISMRSSVRAYAAEQIPEEAMNRILEAGCAAPVGMARYDTLHLTVVQSPELLKRVSQGAMRLTNSDQDPLYGAPTLILVSSQDAGALGLVNASCVTENMLIAAADQGVGSVIIWSSAMAVEADAELKRALGVPSGFKALVGAVYGRAAEPVREKALKLTIGVNRA
jgi:nitroreductase